MDVRRNHKDLSAAEKKKYVDAVLALKNDVDSMLHPGAQKRYDDFVEVHKNAMMGPAMFDPMPHGTPLFFPWHRVLLRQFELALQTVANDSSITIPYWNWDINGANNPFTADFLGGDGDSAQNHRVVDGLFAFAAGKFTVRVWDDVQGDLGLIREFGEDSSSWLPTASDVASGLGKTPYWGGASSWERVCEQALHNPVHRWVGGDDGNMAFVTSPNDPVFFQHHCYIDLLWEQWKTQHPTSEPYLPKSGSKKYDLDATLVFNAQGQTAPWAGTWKVRDTIKTSDLGYAYK